jgi:hypothetical protein
MTTLHIASASTGNTPDDSDSTARVLGAYADPKVAAAVCQVARGVGASVTQVTVDYIDPELLREMSACGMSAMLVQLQQAYIERGCTEQVFDKGQTSPRTEPGAMSHSRP